jgi:cysteine desulfurase/selenocysteine lyase
VVIDAISKYYQEINANIHRGVHTLSQLATDAYRNLARFKTTSMPNLLMKYYIRFSTRNKRYNKWFCLYFESW